MARIREEVDSTATFTALAIDKPTNVTTKTVEEKFTGFTVNTNSSMEVSPVLQDETISLLANEMIIEEIGFCMDTTRSVDPSLDNPSTEQTGFYIDTKPFTATFKEETISVERVDDDALLGEDDIIVYVAPHPRLNKLQPPVAVKPVPSLPSTSILTGTPLNSTAFQNVGTPSLPQAPAFESVSFSFANSPSPRKQPRTRPAFTVGERVKIKTKARKKEARAARRRLERRAMFGQFGAIMSEAQLRSGEHLGKGRDTRWEERRRGDSDVDWGDTDCEEVGAAECEEVSNGFGAMELDSDFDIEAAKAFVKGMSANGGRHVTMDDLADEERMRQEDAEGRPKRGVESGSEEEEAGEVTEKDRMEEEETMMIQDMSPSSSDDDPSDGIDQSPNAGFRAKLERVRKSGRGKKVVHAEASSGEDTSDDDYFSCLTRGEEDEDFMAYITVSIFRDTWSLVTY